MALFGAAAQTAPQSLSGQECRRAALIVCSHAQSADEARDLLGMLGLLEKPATPDQPLKPANPQPKPPQPQRPTPPAPARQPRPITTIRKHRPPQLEGT